MAQVFLFDNVVKNAVITASSFSPGFPVVNIKYPWTTFTWRSQSGVSGAETVSFDTGGSTYDVDAVAIIGANLTSSAVITLNQWSGGWVPISSGFDYDDASGKGILLLGEAETNSKFQLSISDATNPDTYYELGIVAMGEYKTISRGYEYGFSIEYDDKGDISYSLKGFFSYAGGYEEVITSVVYEVLDQDKTALLEVWDACKKKHPFVFVEDPVNAVETMSYVKFRDKMKVKNIDDFFSEISLVWETVK